MPGDIEPGPRKRLLSMRVVVTNEQCDRLTFFVLELDTNRRRLLLQRLDLERELVVGRPCATDVEVLCAVLAFDAGARVDVANEALLSYLDISNDTRHIATGKRSPLSSV